VGLSIIVAGVLALALDSSRPAKHTLRDLTVFGTLGLLPIIAWMVRNVAVTGSASNRGLAWHPPPITVLKKPFALIWEWLSPTVFTYTAFVAIAAASLAIVFTLLIQAWRRGWRPRWRWARALPWLSVGGVLALYVLVYAATVATSLVLFDANTPIDQRIASPISISIVALATAGLGMAVARSRSRAARRLGWLLFLLLAGSYLVRSASLVERLSREGRGYAGPELGASGHVEFIRALPGNLLIYTNSFAPLEFFYGRGSYTIPLPGDPVTGQAVASYADDLLTMRRRIMEGEAVMVLFFASPGEGRIPLELGHGLTLLCGENGVRLYVGDGYRGPRECGP
jgi:hypothetical protein